MIRAITTVVVVLLAAVAAVVSYRHALEVVIANGESGLTAYLVPLTIDGAIFASSMVLLDAARRNLPVPALARWTLALGILATLAANVATGWAHGPVGAIVAAWPAVALVLSYELLMGMVRRGAVPAGVPNGTGTATVQNWTSEVAPVDPWEPSRLMTDSTNVEPAISTKVEPVEVHLSAVPTQVTDSTVRADLPEADDPAEVEVQPAGVPGPDPLYPLALVNFLSDVTVGEVPSVRTIKTVMSVGTDRARNLQAYLGGLVKAAS